MTDQPIRFTCDMFAIAPEDRELHAGTMLKLFGGVQQMKELPDGYAFQLEDGDDALLTAREFISREKLCCPFFGFELRVVPTRQEHWLSLTGPEGVKAFILAELGAVLNTDLIRPGL